MATVTNLTDYGCFAEIQEGVEGLVHVSEMDWTNKNIHPSKVVSVGDQVEVMVLDIDEERRRISLGIKQCRPNPWGEFAQKYAKGDRIKGNIKSITDFGIFIGLEGGIDGLVHLSDISWNEPGETAVRRYSQGRRDRDAGAVDRSRARAHFARRQTARPGSVHRLRRSERSRQRRERRPQRRAEGSPGGAGVRRDRRSEGVRAERRSCRRCAQRAEGRRRDRSQE